jgi:hypothetical protein
MRPGPALDRSPCGTRHPRRRSTGCVSLYGDNHFSDPAPAGVSRSEVNGVGPSSTSSCEVDVAGFARTRGEGVADRVGQLRPEAVRRGADRGERVAVGERSVAVGAQERDLAPFAAHQAKRATFEAAR